MKRRIELHGVMMGSKYIGVIVMVVLVSIFAQGKSVTITGEVVAVDEDSNETPTQVAIQVETDEDYENYNVVLDAKGIELLKQIYNTVEVKGIVKVENDEYWITIKSWKLISEPENYENGMGYKAEDE